MANVITHQGIVENIDDSRISVKIVQTSACATCSAKGHCSSSDSKEKIVEINNFTESYKVGDHVVVVGEMSMGMKAVFLAFVIPFFILVISLFTCMALTGNKELLSAAISFGMLVPYYLILGLNKARLKKNFSFSIKPINS